MCFAAQRRALFRHLNFQKWSGPAVFCTFLRATTACTVSTSQLPKALRQWCVLYILTSKCASRHNGVQFFISHLASWLRTRLFSEPTFRPSGASNHGKHSVSRLSDLFAHLHLLPSDSFFSTLLSSNLFSSLCLCPALLFICLYCRKFDFSTSFDNVIKILPKMDFEADPINKIELFNNKNQFVRSQNHLNFLI